MACLLPAVLLACDGRTRREREMAARAVAAREAAAADAPYQSEVEESVGQAGYYRLSMREEGGRSP